ncbi:regulatory protein RecX [Winkia sp. UMB3158]|uniref:regulatory protein RecX n=1 Tax=unclassified Winkia TaxID=2692119 RepID=UPI0025538A68|nr:MULTISPECIES: regulatory protein RecX [unclassified Winkia]MDK7150244.1 regulatory protein RecX [Winkia sp. UMB3158]MDK8341665.1 regulatory protein RecX [Winkia sp. UMB3164B]MDK8565766.1 regulatory protein RecX [Winkia sp. UMB3164A]
MVSYFDPEQGEAERKRRDPVKAAKRRAKRRQENAELGFDDAVQKAREATLRMLDGAAQSTGQVRKKLSQRGFVTEVIDQVITRFEEVGLLDDLQYAQMLVRTKNAERSLVGRALYAELMKKGISPDIAAQAMQEVSEVDEQELANQLAVKKVGTLKGRPREVIIRRTNAFLARKGYGPGQCRQAIVAALEQF